MTIRDYRDETRDLLRSVCNDEADTVTDILISHYVGIDRAALLAKLDDQAPENLPYLLTDAINMLNIGMPVQYILGSCWFYGLEVKVGPGCFIPRADTEILAQAAICLMKNGGSFVELCAGSGCVSMAITDNVPGVRGTAAELSLNPLPFT